MPDGNLDTSKQITVSDSAVKRLKVLAAEQDQDGLMLRVAVGGGGCSGFQYSFTFDDQINDDDQTIEKDGITVIIDEMSWDYLAGSEVGYREELIGAYFSIENPNAASTCGCGTSFAL
jgi:iron-sulfur cluster insertion protein